MDEAPELTEEVNENEKAHELSPEGLRPKSTAEKTLPRVALLGVSALGEAAAGRLLSSGFQVAFCCRDSVLAGRLEGLGAFRRACLISASPPPPTCLSTWLGGCSH